MQTRLDKKIYKKGIKVPKHEMELLNIEINFMVNGIIQFIQDIENR